MPEPKSLPKETEDGEFFNQSLVDDVGAAPVDIVDVACLGGKVANKLCSLRLQFNNLSHRRLF